MATVTGGQKAGASDSGGKMNGELCELLRGHYFRLITLIRLRDHIRVIRLQSLACVSQLE